MKTKILIGSAIAIIIVASLLFMQEQRKRSQVMNYLDEIFGPVTTDTSTSFKSLAFAGLFSSECDDAWDNLLIEIKLLGYAQNGYMDDYFIGSRVFGISKGPDEMPEISGFDQNYPLRLRRNNNEGIKNPELYRTVKNAIDNTRRFIADNCDM